MQYPDKLSAEFKPPSDCPGCSGPVRTHESYGDYTPEDGLRFIVCDDFHERLCDFQTAHIVTRCIQCPDPMYVPISLGPREKIIEELSKGQFKHTHCYRPYGCGEAWELERYVDSRVSGNKDLYPREYPHWEKLVELLGEKQPLDLLRKFNEVMKRCPEYVGDYEGPADSLGSWDIHKAIDFIERHQSDERLTRADIEYLVAKINDMNLVKNEAAAEWITEYFESIGPVILPSPYLPVRTNYLLPELQDVTSLGAKVSVLTAIRTYFADEMWLELIDQPWDARKGFREWLKDPLKAKILQVSVGWVPYIYKQHMPRIEQWLDEVSTALASAGPKRRRKVPTDATPNDVCLAALKIWHKYADPGEGGDAFDPSVLNYEPIGVRQMAAKYEKPKSTVSNFFKDGFGNHRNYQSACLKKTIANVIFRLRAKDWDRTRQLDDSYEPLTYDPEPIDP